MMGKPFFIAGRCIVLIDNDQEKTRKYDGKTRKVLGKTISDGYKTRKYDDKTRRDDD